MFFAEVESSGFMGMFENNVINWVLLVLFLGWVMGKKLPPVFKGRRESINATLEAARKAREEAEHLLEKQKAAVANAEVEAEKIIAEARHAAKEMQASLEAQTHKDIEDLLAKFEGSIASERQMLVNEMRQATVRAALELTKGQLASSVTPEVKATLLNQFMAQLETLNTRHGALSSGASLESISK